MSDVHTKAGKCNPSALSRSRQNQVVAGLIHSVGFSIGFSPGCTRIVGLEELGIPQRSCRSVEDKQLDQGGLDHISFYMFVTRYRVLFFL